MKRPSREPVRILPVCACVAMIFAFGPGLRAAEAEPVPQRPVLLTPAAAGAVQRGLAYLARTQARDGSWSGGRGMARYPCVMTALAGLALLAAGNTPIEGKYARQVRKATDYLLRRSQRTGLIASMAEASRSMYGHGFAMLFLAEVYGMEPDLRRQKRIRSVLRRAVALTARSQSRAGGWLYTPNSNSDEGSVTVTQIQGLRACRNAGIKVPKSTIDRACEYIRKCANADGGICYSLRSRGSSRPAITAAAVATMYNAGAYENPVAVKALEYIKRLIAGKGHNAWNAFRGHRYYSLLYASQAMWFAGEADWKRFFPPVRDALVKAQGGDGAWNGDYVGKVYGTAIALLILQIPNQYLPILQR